MQTFQVKAVLLTALASFALSAYPERVFAAPETPDQAVPQGEDAPEAENPDQPLPPSEHKGVIEPPPTGDKEIYTDVPNPEAGHDKEVIPPSDLPQGDPPSPPR